MKINNKILSIPPYISTSWNNVLAIHMRDSVLVISLNDGNTVDVPDLKPEIIELIFAAHASHFERNSDRPASSIQPSHPLKTGNPLFSTLANDADIPFRLGFGTFDSLGSALQHNPSQANAPDLPKEILNKISAIAKIVAPEEAINTPKPEPHCNCIHCQIARAINSGLDDSQQQQQQETEEEVSNEDLKFCQWEIIQTGDKLYTVINRLDENEKYSVFLGHPLGCTCGKQGCEHILAVLKS